MEILFETRENANLFIGQLTDMHKARGVVTVGEVNWLVDTLFVDEDLERLVHIPDYIQIREYHGMSASLFISLETYSNKHQSPKKCIHCDSTTTRHVIKPDLEDVNTLYASVWICDNCYNSILKKNTLERRIKL